MSEMHITDIHGRKIQITDLDKAIEQAEAFAAYTSEGANPKFNRQRQSYWQDICRKLKELKQNNQQ